MNKNLLSIVKHISGTKFLWDGCKNQVNRHFFVRKIIFHVSRFLVMHGMPLLWVTRDEKNFWENEDYSSFEGKHSYVVIEGSTRMMFRDLLEVVGKGTSFLEVGCNAGRNLQYLFDQGFRNLAGIEINHGAVHDLMKVHFPELYQTGKFFVGNALDQIRKLETESHDVVFAHSVLIHIPPTERKLFAEMVRVSAKYIVVLSQENTSSCYPYNFKKIFEDLGCKEIVSRIFYGGREHDFSWDSTNYKLPVAKYDRKNNYFDAWALKIFAIAI